MTPRTSPRGAQPRAPAAWLGIGCLAALLVGGCSSDSLDGSEPNNQEFAAMECSLSSSLEAVLGHGSSLSYAAARAWKADGVYHFQLLPTGAEKEAASELVHAWLLPPSGALTLSLDVDSPENSTFQIGPEPALSPSVVPLDQIVVSLATADSPIGASGQASVGRNIFHLPGDYARFDIMWIDVPLTDGGRLTGSASIECGEPVRR